MISIRIVVLCILVYITDIISLTILVFISYNSENYQRNESYNQIHCMKNKGTTNKFSFPEFVESNAARTLSKHKTEQKADPSCVEDSDSR